jgi:CheY-like chemotaxis protein
VAKPKILIVEDEPLLREAYYHVLTHKGYRVAVAADGIEGLERLRSFEPQIILLDVLMPRLDGIGFLQRADLKQRYPGTKVVACTNLSDHATAEQMMLYGADRQVLKANLSPRQLIALVEDVTAEL